MDTESEHDALVRLQIERDTSKQVEDILNDFKKDIDLRLEKIMSYLEARPTNEQMESAMNTCLQEKPIVYKQDFYDMWVKAKEQYTEKSTGKARNWIDTAKGIAWVILIIVGVVSLMGDSIPEIVRILSGG